ncbi:MAG: hypothetical protein K8R88_12895, partial [Armatimonadetes bacterium]|nr:hypothetical protein [Armatimonadota bacterium]
MTTLRGLIAKLTRDDSYLAVNEYWVYVPGTVLPLQAQVMDRMVKDNPHHRKGHAPIGAKEGMVFTDIRLHVALVLKSKNPHAFRPDLLAEVPMEVTPEILGGLASSQALIKIQYVSKHTLLDDRHLTFLSHLADAYADIGDGTVVYDLIQERLWSASDYRATLDDAETSVADQHCRVIWEPEDQHGRIRVLGLAKVGGTVWLSESVPA